MAADPETTIADTAVAQAATAEAFLGPPGVLLVDRFRLERRLGSGSMGTVFSAYDTHSDCRVALKFIREISPALRFQAKQEFRSLQDVRHRNLGRLYELFEVGERLVTSMELVEGVDIVSYVRAACGGASVLSSRIGERHLRAAIAQLASALVAVHGAGKVHRDVKPANVLVRRDGVLKLVDFGLVANLADVARDSDVVGTPHFMAPEQVLGDALGPPCDWYAVGSILFLALTGRRPFEGTQAVVLASKLMQDAPPLRGLIPDVPLEWEQLCDGLLDRIAERRSGAAEVLACGGVRSEPTRRARTAFVGRTAEREALARALEEAVNRPIAVTIAGVSGIGKSALLDRFLQETTTGVPSRWVLRARCHEHEYVPYKGVDGIVDNLVERFVADPAWLEDERIRKAVAVLAQTFPALGSVDSADGKPPPSWADPPGVAQRRVFQTFRSLLRVLGESKELTLAIDDVQWIDGDSVALLRAVLGGADAPNVLLVLTRRTEAPESERAISMDSSVHAPGDLSLACEVRSIALGPLAPSEASELAHGVLRDLRNDRPLDLGDLVSEAAGHPMLLAELARYAGSRPPTSGTRATIRLDEALSHRLRSLDAADRRLLDILALSGGQLPLAVAAKAAGASPTAAHASLASLQSMNLARSNGRGRSTRIEVFHDRIRECVMSLLPTPAATTLSGALAGALEAMGGAPAGVLAVHWYRAGDARRALTYSSLGAEHALASLAFDHAARLLGLAVEAGRALDESVSVLEERRAEALALAMRPVDAAEAFLAAATASSERHRALELRRRAAERLLACGHFEEGLPLLETTGRELRVPVPRTHRSAFLALVWNRARVRLRGTRFVARTEEECDQEDLLRLDFCWTAVIGFAMTDTIRGADFQARGLLLALRAGEPSRVCRALATEATMAMALGDEQRSAAVQAIGQNVSDSLGRPPRLEAILVTTAAIMSFVRGRFRDVPALAERAEALARSHPRDVVHHEIDQARIVHVSALTITGQFRRFHEIHGPFLAEAIAQRSIHMETNLRTGIHVLVWLAHDDVALAKRMADEAIAPWSAERVNVPHLIDLWARSTIALFEGHSADALTMLLDSWGPIKGTYLLEGTYYRIQMVSARGRAALAAAAEGSNAKLLGTAARDGRRLAREEQVDGRAMGQALLGGVAWLSGNEPQALHHLVEAERLFEESGMAMNASAVRRAWGAILGGALGAARIAEADAAMESEGVLVPERLAALLAPGFPHAVSRASSIRRIVPG